MPIGNAAIVSLYDITVPNMWHKGETANENVSITPHNKLVYLASIHAKNDTMPETRVVKRRIANVTTQSNQQVTRRLLLACRKHTLESMNAKTSTQKGEKIMLEDPYSNETVWGPSMEVVQARHQAALTHRCSCGNQRDPTEIKHVGSRRWISCLRCLGTIEQLS